MKRLWLCVVISLLLHALLFPDFLQAMLASGAANSAGPDRSRVSVKLVASKPKPKPVAPVVKRPPPPVVKRTPPPPPRPQIAQPAARTQPPPRPTRQAPPAQAPPPRPVAATPQSRPATTRPTGGRPPRSNRRLSGTTTPRGNSRSVPQPPPSEPGGQAGTTPPPSGSQEDSAPGNGTGDGPGDGEAGPASEPPSGPASEPVGSVPDPGPSNLPEPRPSPKPSSTPLPLPSPSETPRSASTAPKVREASVEVPTIRLPASLRRESLKTTLQVRAVIQPGGEADFKLAESCGNPEVDDYVLEQLRKVAIVTTALDDKGQPKRALKKLQVNIEVD